MAKRRNEAYGVVSDSRDEVFLTTLYDWYLEQGWSERLLQSDSPFVVAYLERKADDDIEHADLLWRYFAQSERFFEAAKVQLQLAQSSFNIPLSRRIEYLGWARANASIFTPDVSRQARQRLVQETSNLIDVADIQDEILQRLKDDPRVAPEAKPQVLKEVDGAIRDISYVCVTPRKLPFPHHFPLYLMLISSLTISPTLEATTISVCRSSSTPTTATRLTSSPHGNISCKTSTTGSWSGASPSPTKR